MYVCVVRVEGYVDNVVWKFIDRVLAVLFLEVSGNFLLQIQFLC